MSTSGLGSLNGTRGKAIGVLVLVVALAGGALAWSMSQAGAANEPGNTFVSINTGPAAEPAGRIAPGESLPELLNLQTGPTDIFLELEGIEGGSIIEGYEGHIQLPAVQFGISAAVAGGGGTNRASRPTFSDISAMKILDKSSPKLMEAIATGQVLPTAVIRFTRAGGQGERFEYLVIKLENVQITSYQLSSGGDIPTESLSLNFDKIEVSYKEQQADGSEGGSVEFSWDVKKNQSN